MGIGAISKPLLKAGRTLIDELGELGAKNLRTVGQKSVSGSTFERKTADELAKLKRTGIDVIVDFRSEASSEFAKRCKDAKLDYLLFPLEHTRAGISGIKGGTETKPISDEFVEKLKKFMDITNEKSAYIGCNYGIDRTNLGLVLNYLLNPKVATPPKILTWGDFRSKSVINKTLKIARKMIKKMTPEQKQSLGLSGDYNADFQKKIGQLLSINHLA